MINGFVTGGMLFEYCNKSSWEVFFMDLKVQHIRIECLKYDIPDKSCSFFFCLTCHNYTGRRVNFINILLCVLKNTKIDETQPWKQTRQIISNKSHTQYSYLWSHSRKIIINLRLFLSKVCIDEKFVNHKYGAEISLLWSNMFFF